MFKGGYLNNVSSVQGKRGIECNLQNLILLVFPFLLLLVLGLRLMQVVRLSMMVGEAARMVTMMLTDG